MGEEYIGPQKTARSILGELHDWVEAGMMAVVCVVLLFTFVARIAGVEGDSMLPTLHDQDRVIITRVLLAPKTGDIVVISKPNYRNEPLVKRVIAAQGQTVDIDFEAHTVTVDGVLLEEEYINEPTRLQYDVEFPQTVPPGHVFVMGDNRNHSWDSRDSHIGMIDERYILGRVIFRLLPLDDVGVPR